MHKGLRERFEANIMPIPECGCWIWMGAYSGKPPYDYGKFGLDGESLWAHRVSWMVYKGVIPSGLNICHKCDTSLCVNPEHLFLGTQRDNIRDAITKKRMNPHCNKVGAGERGENHHCAKLTDKEILEIRISNKSQRVLAGQYNIDQSIISKIKHFKIWKHI